MDFVVIRIVVSMITMKQLNNIDNKIKIPEIVEVIVEEIAEEIAEVIEAVIAAVIEEGIVEEIAIVIITVVDHAIIRRHHHHHHHQADIRHHATVSVVINFLPFALFFIIVMRHFGQKILNQHLINGKKRTINKKMKFFFV